MLYKTSARPTLNEVSIFNVAKSARISSRRALILSVSIFDSASVAFFLRSASTHSSSFSFSCSSALSVFLLKSRTAASSLLSASASMPPPLFSLSLLTSLSSLLRSAVASLGAVHEKDEDELELELELVALKSILAKYRHEKQIGQVD